MHEYHSSPDLSHAVAPASHVLDMAERMKDLPPQVEERKQTLVKEVLDLCRKYGLAHPKELETSPAAARIPLEDLEHLLAHTTELEYIVEHRELPEDKEKKIDDKEYEIKLPTGAQYLQVFDDHGYPMVSGKMAMEDQSFVRDPEGNEYLFSTDPEFSPRDSSLAKYGEQVIVVQELVRMKKGIFVKRKCEIQDLDGLPFGDLERFYPYVGVADHKIVTITSSTDEKSNRRVTHPVNRDGRIIGRPEGYFSTFPPVSLGGHVYFTALEERNAQVHVFDEQGDQVEKRDYDDIHSLFDVGGKLVLCVEKDGRWFFVYPDGSLLDGEPKEGFGEIMMSKVFEGKIYFLARVERQPRDVFILMDHTGKNFEKDPHCFDKDFNPVGMKKVGEDMYFLKLASDENFETIRVTPEKVTSWKTDGVFPILVGKTRVDTQVSIGSLSVITSSQGLYTTIVGQIYALESIDDHRFYVIAEDKGKIVKKVFDIHHPAEPCGTFF